MTGAPESVEQPSNGGRPVFTTGAWLSRPLTRGVSASTLSAWRRRRRDRPTPPSPTHWWGPTPDTRFLPEHGLPPKFGPSFLLRSEYRIIPFHGRDDWPIDGLRGESAWGAWMGYGLKLCEAGDEDEGARWMNRARELPYGRITRPRFSDLI